MKTRDQFYDEIKAEPINNDREIMVKVLKYCLESLDKCKIYVYQAFIEQLKKFELNSKDLRDYIMKFIEYIKSVNHTEDDISFNWISKRSIKKANSSEKNLIINLLAHQYPNELLYFTQEYIKKNAPEMSSIEIFFIEFVKMIDNLNSSATS